MNDNSETRRFWIFILSVFGIAWLTALVIAFNGGIANSPDILIFPAQLNPSFVRLQQLLPAGAAAIKPYVFVALQALQGIFLSVVISSPFTFGEEFG